MDEQFEAQIRRLGANSSEYAAEERQLFDKTWDRRLGTPSLAATGATVRIELKEKYDRLHEQLGDVCASYLRMNADEREAARRLVGEYQELTRQLVNHLEWEAGKAESKVDQESVMRKLAGVSLADLRGADIRDLLIAIGNLYVRAYDNGTFLSIPLARIAELSNALPRPPKSDSMRDFFLNFEESAYFKSSVEPKLNRGK